MHTRIPGALALRIALLIALTVSMIVAGAPAGATPVSNGASTTFTISPAETLQVGWFDGDDPNTAATEAAPEQIGPSVVYGRTPSGTFGASDRAGIRAWFYAANGTGCTTGPSCRGYQVSLQAVQTTGDVRPQDFSIVDDEITIDQGSPINTAALLGRVLFSPDSPTALNTAVPIVTVTSTIQGAIVVAINVRFNGDFRLPGDNPITFTLSIASYPPA